MAKKKSSKNSSNLISSIVVLAVAVLTICSLFMPVFRQFTVQTGVDLWTAKGSDVFAAAFASEASLDMSAGTAALYALKAAEDTAFVAVVAYWAYMLMVAVSCGVVVTKVLGLLGIRLKLVDTILGVALVLCAIVAFIFALVAAGKMTSVTTILNAETGIKCLVQVGMYIACIGGLVGGVCTLFGARN